MSEGQRTYAGGFSDSGFDAIPVWDGRGDTLRDFKKQITWWLSSIDLKKTTAFNLAARFSLRQRGAAKLRALEFTPDELGWIPTPRRRSCCGAGYDARIQKILNAWDDMIGRSVTDRKGELREKYYLRMKRGHTEGVVGFSLCFRTLIAECGVRGSLSMMPRRPGSSSRSWGLRRFSAKCLRPLWAPWLRTMLPTCEKEVIRLFKQIRLVAPPQARKPFGGPGLASDLGNGSSVSPGRLGIPPRGLHHRHQGRAPVARWQV